MRVCFLIVCFAAGGLALEAPIAPNGTSHQWGSRGMNTFCGMNVGRKWWHLP